MSYLKSLEPKDEHNLKLESHVHPTDYTNPEPASKYNLVVIGAGTAGLVTAAAAAGLGAKVALVERGLMGGDCLNVGCVPSKGIISAARAMAHVRNASRFGVRIDSDIKLDFGETMARMRALRARISHHDSVERFTKLGIDVFLGQASFLDSSIVAVDGKKLHFRKAVLCTGARAAAPTIKGLDSVDYLTNETLFSLSRLPKRLGVIGGGPVGCEMAQAFARFGSKVTLISSDGHILPREDQEAANIIQTSMEKDGVLVRAGGKDLRVSQGSSGAIFLEGNDIEEDYREEVDQLLVATGRTPNVEGLNLEKVGVDYSPSGVAIDDYFRTSNSNIYAAGDICSPYKFTHAADFMARAVVRNALFLGRTRHSDLIIPWCTYTSPELAQVGLTPREANQRHIPIDTFTQPMSGVDRAILEGETEGFVRIHTKRGKDKILGATIVAPNAGDMIGSLAIAMSNGIGLGAIANSIHPYPTQGEAIRKVGDLYNKTRLTPRVAKWFKRWLDFTRG